MADLTIGILAGLGTSLNWAIISILVRSLSGIVPSVGITAARSTVGGAIILLGALAAGYGGEIVRMPLWVVFLLWASVIIAMGIGDTAFFASMDSLGVTRALALSMANPLLTTLVGIGLFGEEVTLPRVLGILLVVGGLLLIIWGKGETEAKHHRSARRGIRLVFIASAVWALSAILLKPPLQVVSVVSAAAIRIPASGVFLWLTPWTRGSLGAIRRSSRTEQARLAIICLLSGFGSLLFTAGIKYAGVAVGNVLSSTAPLFSLPFEIWVLGQRPSRRMVLGAVVTVTGIGLMNL